ncbi:MAG: hypothetical protein LZ169_07215 [Thaumarchaeota archaeon]|jgi:hypothetical protein|nr:hypothetical protein [Candidatus Wolframiiraptor allenii]
MQFARDLSKIGILLIGVALIVIAVIAMHFYTTYVIPQISRPWLVPQFYAYCRYKTIVIHADRDLADIKVLDNRSNQLCLFEKIPAAQKRSAMSRVTGYTLSKLETISASSNVWRRR